MNNLLQKLHLTGSTLAICAASTFVATAAWAQATNNTPVEEVVVTGTSIRGVAPVGSNLTTIGVEDIKATGASVVQGILASSPQLMGLGSSGNGQTGQNAQEASIHQFGNSASTSTLTLIDGHRVPATGTNHSFVDPNLVPINMLERVEVLADGVSAVYGSDAVAGVVNFITRKHFEGLELTGSASFIDGKQDVSGGFVAGKDWDTGGAIFAYSYVRQGVLLDTARPYTSPNHIAQGGTNFGNFNCDPATLSPSGQALIFTSATSGQTLANTAANSPCSTWAYGSLIPKTVRNNAMIKVRQDFGSDWTLDSEMLYGTRRVSGPTPRGTLSATAFGSGAQANPFFTQPAGYAGGATTQAIKWDADALLGPGAALTNGADTMYADANLEYRFRGWTFDLMALVGRDDSVMGSTGTLNGSVATLALNGTANAGGSLTQVVPNTTLIPLQLPLTAANALDIWNPAATNRTSAAVIKQLTDNTQSYHVVNGLNQAHLTAQGTVFDLPAGPVKMAVGAESLHNSIFESVAQLQGSGPASNASVFRTWNFSRDIQSVYGEVNIPVVSADQNVPFVQSINVDVSGRFDHYSDFGNTSNPKIAFDWRVDSDLKFRANWSTSFVAAPTDELGADGTWNNTNYQPYPTNSIAVPVALFPLVTQFGLAGCTAASVTCDISTLRGLHITNGNPHQDPSKGRGWSAGFDYAPSYIPGLTFGFTYWSTKIKGGSTGPQIAAISSNASLANLLTFYPACATPAQISAIAKTLPLTAPLEACTQYIVNTLNSSYLNLHSEGVDSSINYVLPTDSWGTFTAGDAISVFTLFKESLGAAGQEYDVSNTTGANSFPTVGLQMRGNVGWALDAFSAQLFVNYTGSYRNWGSPKNPITTDPVTHNPTGGGDPVKANVTFDVNLAYDFNDGYLGNDQVSLNIRNIFDRDPPFYNSANGYDTNVANPLGRVITLGLTTKL
ncbi:MAG TPA: TonB-dependent receptor [Rhizomicrobium sp.]|nr:TonB-dependent receptor [Rhizomicrobium sp.]